MTEFDLKLPTFSSQTWKIKLGTKILQNTANFHPKLYSRYVDDMFCVFNDETSSNKFLD